MSRWQRPLFLLAVVLGVVTMHSDVVPAAGPGCEGSGAHAIAHGTQPAAVAMSRPNQHDCGHDSGAYSFLRLCLASLAAAVVAALVIAFAAAHDRRPHYEREHFPSDEPIVCLGGYSGAEHTVGRT